VKTIGVHGQFVSCIRWAPSPATSDAPKESLEATNGIVTKDAGKAAIRCVVATGSADQCIRVFHRIVFLLQFEPDGLEKWAVYHVRGKDVESSVKC
jgi:hypothetical protein